MVDNQLSVEKNMHVAYDCTFHGGLSWGLELLTAHWVPFGSQKPSVAPQQN